MKSLDKSAIYQIADVNGSDEDLDDLEDSSRVPLRYTKNT